MNNIQREVFGFIELFNLNKVNRILQHLYMFSYIELRMKPLLRPIPFTNVWCICVHTAHIQKHLLEYGLWRFSNFTSIPLVLFMVLSLELSMLLHWLAHPSQLSYSSISAKRLILFAETLNVNDFPFIELPTMMRSTLPYVQCFNIETETDRRA